MNKYKRLMSNTLVFGIATFGAKLLPFVLMKLYTKLLTPADYSTKELIVGTCNLILPVMYLSVSEAVVRYGLDGAVRKRDVFTTGVLTVLAGYLVLLSSSPLLRMIPAVGEYLPLVCLYVLASAMHTVIAQFVRASGLVRMFAFDGIVTTLNTVLLNILLLAKLNMGVTGYVLSIIIADALSALGLFLVLRLHRFFRIRGMNWDTALQMLRYSIPLVPTAVFWWVTNLSDRYFITFISGKTANGLYSVASTLPAMITLVSAIFTQAWQLSAFTEYQTPEGEQFYSTVFQSYYTFVFLASSGIIMFAKPVMRLMTQPPYYEAWRYVPFLVLAVAFSCLVTFLGSVYNAVRRNGMIMLTTFIGAIVNILLNWQLIPVFGAQGAAVATFASYFLVFLIRAVDTRKYIRIRMQPARLALNLCLLLAQITTLLLQVPYWPLWQAAIFILLMLCNVGNILFLLRHILSMLRMRRRA